MEDQRKKKKLSSPLQFFSPSLSAPFQQAAIKVATKDARNGRGLLAYDTDEAIFRSVILFLRRAAIEHE